MDETWHEHLLRVYYKDTDQMGVVHHGNYVNWFEMGRTEMMQEAGIAYSDIEDLGLLLPVLNLDINYHKSAAYNECVAVYTKIGHYTPIKLQFDYEVRKIDEERFLAQKVSGEGAGKEKEGELLVSGSTLHMWLNKKWKPARIDKTAPDIFERIKREVSNQ
ncbi:acyl-CoA thioesterase [Virgibacillus ihumii]|uniref:acyl-CoA thioesterase n=1 Tax=Virgibacillus ihumii TaxID=2686091 RepID=UPI00157DF1C2|nr:thioesterase family protein [Virgibacillus ihumii]